MKLEIFRSILALMKGPNSKWRDYEKLSTFVTSKNLVIMDSPLLGIIDRIGRPMSRFPLTVFWLIRRLCKTTRILWSNMCRHPHNLFHGIHACKLHEEGI